MFLWSFFARLRGGTMTRFAKSIRVAIDHFLRKPPHNKISPRSLTRQINYQSICKRPQENRLYCRHSPYETNSQWADKELFDLRELISAEIETNPSQLQRTTWFLTWSLFLADDDERINDSQRQQICSCEKHIKELSVLSFIRSNPVYYQPRKTIRLVSNLGNSVDESDAKIVSLLNSESG